MPATHITIYPPLTCQYLPECTNLATDALIWTNEIMPIRWVMMPVCPGCMSAASAMYLSPIVPKQTIYVKGGLENVKKV